MKKPIMLMILDGWGHSEDKEYNAVYKAKTPNLDRYVNEYPNTLLKCSGLDVGLPKGFMGNSEVGHLNIGAGRIVYQELTRIDKAIEDKSFFQNENINKAFNIAIEKGVNLHLMGLLSDGGVHSHIDHIRAFFKLACIKNFKNIVIHPFFDGRDTPPQSGIMYLEKLLEIINEYGFGTLATLSGRFYAMDRDKRWERLERAYLAMTSAEPFFDGTATDYVKQSYEKGINDEFIEPVCLDRSKVIKNEDVLVFINFRADRAREITQAFTNPIFNGFERTVKPKLSYYLCMTEYDQKFNLPVAFDKQNLDNLFGEVISKNGLKQLRIAETEKYAHVTFFFNGGKEKPSEGEDRILIDSPRDVATYDLKPEMSAIELTERLLTELDKDFYDFIVVNYANCDMVGHTGVFEATVKAVEAVDFCSSKIIERVLFRNGVVFLTADHGNAEKMMEKGVPYTSHTTNPVRFVLIDNDKRGITLNNEGRLADIMPTILKQMGLNTPSELTGESLL